MIMKVMKIIKMMINKNKIDLYLNVYYVLNIKNDEEN